MLFTIFVPKYIIHFFMKKFHFIITAALASMLPANAARINSNKGLHALSTATDSIIQNYSDSLASLVERLDEQPTTATSPSPYLFRLLGQGTLYNSALVQQMSQQQPVAKANILPSLGSTDDDQLLLVEASNNQLARAYTSYPQLFKTTENVLTETGGLRTDISQPIVEETKLAEKIVEELPDVEVEEIEPEVKKPNFWTYKGNGGLQFTQSYFSKNWYKGGENSYTMLSLLSFDANYNNQRRVQLDNRFEARLGFQTTNSYKPKFRPTDNLLRFTSNLGIKAIGNWNYSAQLQLQSQPYRGYEGSSTKVISDFLSPLYVRSSIGMDFNIKKERFTGKLHLAPLSYVITYVHVDSRVTRYGIKQGHNSKHEWGPNIEFTFDYRITKDILWKSRTYWFTTFKLTRLEMENTINFAINKYLSAKLFVNPRFEDTRYWGNEDARRTHWMLQESFSLGLNYDF